MFVFFLALAHATNSPENAWPGVTRDHMKALEIGAASWTDHSGKTYQGSGNGITGTGDSNIRVQSCAFIQCTTSTGEGGAIHYKGTGSVIVDTCSFSECNGKGEYGGSVYAEVGDFSFDRCTVSDSTAKFNTVQFKLKTAKPVTLTRNTFRDITVTGTSENANSGSGLGLTNIASIDLIDCHFLFCTTAAGRGGGVAFSLNAGQNPPEKKVSIQACTFSGTRCNSRGGGLAAILPNEPDWIFTIQDTVFLNCTSEDAGAIVINSNSGLKSCIIDNCTVQDCEVRGVSGLGHSIVINNAHSLFMDTLKMIDMPGGMGCIKIPRPTDVTFLGCTFEQVKTRFIFNYDNGAAFALNLTNCVFTGLDVVTSNFIEVGKDSKVTEFVLSGCTFQSVTSEWDS